MKTSKHGFTIVELVIVIAVIGILASVLVPTFSGVADSANESSALQEASRLIKQYAIENPEVHSFTDGGTDYYVAYFAVVRGGKTYYFRYGMKRQPEQISASELPTFSDFAALEVYADGEEAGAGESVKLYGKTLHSGEYLRYQVTPADEDGNFSITVQYDLDKLYWVLSDDYYSLTRLGDIVFPEEPAAGEEEAGNDTSGIVTDAAGLQYQSNGSGGVSIVGYEGTDTVVVIPDTSPDGTPVTSIAWRAFISKPITSVTMGKNITEIGQKAFRSCAKLQTVTLNEGIRTIQGEAFYNCTSLSSINLPASLTEIASVAFKRCQSLAGVTVPDGCTVNSGAFGNATEISFANGTDTMTDGKYIYRLIDGALTSELNTTPTEKTLLCLKKDCTIPENQNITCIGEDCFANETITSVHIPDSVTELAAQSFYNNLYLKEITGGSCVKTIGKQAFNSCKNLESFTLSDTVESLGASVFVSCGKLTVTLSGNQTLASGALSSVKKIVLENESTYHMVGGCVVNSSGEVCQCEYDAAIPTDASVTALGTQCFSSCGISGDIVIPGNITVMKPECLRDCAKIKTLYIGKNVKEIGRQCFYCCTGLQSAVLECEIATLPTYIFTCCSSLAEVTLPESVREIGKYAFSSCTSLTTIRYGGTKADWQSITFGQNWNSGMPEFSVICSDGTLKSKP